jgi:glycosyltransferase involved in cell wall biosynthesis
MESMSKKFRKIRILWCGEASYLKTGYAIYAKEVLTRLYKTGKYKIAEMGCYSAHTHPEIASIPWRFYPTLPINEEENHTYASNQSNQFGKWRFDDICLDFRPDVVIDIRDWWMMEYQQHAAFRRFYKWAIMPTVDSFPQQEQYISTFMDADAVFTYSEFGKEVLEEESNNHIKIIGTPSPGADFDILKPVANKSQHRSQYGFHEDVNIIGTVMRNQRRKLYPNLIKSFRDMLDNNPELRKNTFLYLHTSYPDLGWDLPYFIRKYKMGNHAIMTYKCRSCGNFFPSFYQGPVAPCDKCGSHNATMPNTTYGVTSEELGKIINWFDLYVQYSICEGFGMPQVEAAACGVPVLTVDYSAMESVAKKIKAETVSAKSFFWDSPTHSQRAIPDDEELVEKMVKFIKLPKSVKSKKGMDAYIGAKKHYNWENAAKIWEDYFDTIEPLTHEETWDSQPKIHQPHTSMPKEMNNEEFVEWGIKNIWGQPSQVNSYIGIRLIKDLTCGKMSASETNDLYYNGNSYAEGQQTFSEFTREEAINTLVGMCDYDNDWETKRSRLTQGSETGWAGVERAPFLSLVKPDDNYSNTAD